MEFEHILILTSSMTCKKARMCEIRMSVSNPLGQNKINQKIVVLDRFECSRFQNFHDS